MMIRCSLETGLPQIHNSFGKFFVGGEEEET
jgi:hypothetical protein